MAYWNAIFSAVCLMGRDEKTSACAPSTPVCMDRDQTRHIACIVLQHCALLPGAARHQNWDQCICSLGSTSAATLLETCPQHGALL